MYSNTKQQSSTKQNHNYFSTDINEKILGEFCHYLLLYLGYFLWNYKRIIEGEV